MKNIFSIVVLLLLLSCAGIEESESSPPNFVWIMLEDWGQQLSCYDEPGISTPFVDELAASGKRYTNAYATAPVCSPSRSAMMTGFHQNFIGANQHRTGERYGLPKQSLPEGIRPLTHQLRDVGYHISFMFNKKTDLNFTYEGDLYDSDDWTNREPDQPFFVQITLAATHRIWRRDSINPIDIADIRLPPYYPQTNLAKRDWANGLEAMQNVDRQVGNILKRLDDEGLSENTVVFLIGDNGRCMPRGKQFLYDGGIQVPLIIRWPSEFDPGLVSDELVSTLDISKTILDLAQVKTKIPLHGMNLLNGDTKERKYVFAARDKMDSTHDAMRAVRTKNHKLIHNLMPERPYVQYNKYKEQNYPVLAELNILSLKGMLTEDQAKFMAPSKPEFELYDLVEDPYELNNLAYNTEFEELKLELIQALEDWRDRMKDTGVSAEFRQGGWPATYPTRSLEEWEEVLEVFEPWVFREPESKMKHPRQTDWK